MNQNFEHLIQKLEKYSIKLNRETKSVFFFNQSLPIPISVLLLVIFGYFSLDINLCLILAQHHKHETPCEYQTHYLAIMICKIRLLTFHPVKVVSE